MKEDNKLAKGLLKQNGIEAGKISQEALEKIHREVAKERSRVKRMKWIVITLLAVWLTPFVAGAIWVLLHGQELDTPPQWGFNIGVIYRMFTYVLLACVIIYLRHWYRLKTKINSATQSHIQEHLANIEAQLRELAKKG